MPQTLVVHLPPGTPWYRYLGPWPFRPGVVFILATYFYIVTATGQMAGQPILDMSLWAFTAIGLGVPAAGMIAVILMIGRRFQYRHGVRIGSYVVLIALASLIAVTFRISAGAVPMGLYWSPATAGFAVIRTALMIVLVLAVTGYITSQLQRQIDATQTALDQVREQQEVMLEADESARRQVATLLHDKVQAGLIAACLELQELAAAGDDQVKRSAVQVIERLEHLRALDVRRAARALSPSLHEVDLRTSLEELAAQYEPVIATHVSVDQGLDSRRDHMEPDVLLGCYRVVEQALLNAARHGRAQQVTISVADMGSAITISVADDGRGIGPNPPEPGLGSAILTTWTRRYDGDWALTNRPTGGAELVVTLYYT